MTLDCRLAGLTVPAGDFDKLSPVVVSPRRLERGENGALRFVVPQRAQKVGPDDWCDVLARYAVSDKGCREELGTFDTAVAEGQSPVTPLSINIPRPTIVLIELHDNTAMQFSARGSGITVNLGDARGTALAGKMLLRDGEVKVIMTPDYPGEGRAIDNGCQFAFFAVSPPHGTGIFELPFNLHIEQVGKIEGKAYRFPIVIDPDTRHPGGTRDV